MRELDPEYALKEHVLESMGVNQENQERQSSAILQTVVCIILYHTQSPKLTWIYLAIWTQWSESGTCSVTCGGGKQQYERTCKSSEAGTILGNRQCEAHAPDTSSTKELNCNNNRCRKYFILQIILNYKKNKSSNGYVVRLVTLSGNMWWRFYWKITKMYGWYCWAIRMSGRTDWN